MIVGEPVIVTLANGKEKRGHVLTVETRRAWSTQRLREDRQVWIRVGFSGGKVDWLPARQVRSEMR